MNSERKLELLGSLITHKKGFAFKAADYQISGVPVIRVSNFSGDGISKFDLKFVSEVIAEQNMSVCLKPDDIVIATVGSWPNNPDSVVGRTISVPEWAAGSLMNQNSVIIRAKSGCPADQMFIYYQMKSAAFSHHIISRAQGSANQASITLETIFSFPVWWPEASIRREIGLVLSSFDKRINLLRESNATLESITQAIFKSWFIDFDPVHAKIKGLCPEGMDEAIAGLFPDSFEESELGMIPRGWGVRRIEEILQLSYGKALKASDRINGDIPVYGSGGVTGFHNEGFVNGPSIVVGRKGTIGTIYWEDRQFFPIDTVFYVQSSYSMTYCFYLLQTLGLNTMNTDAAVPGLNRNNVYRLIVPNIPDSLIMAFDSLALLMRQSIRRNLDESQTLISLRDSLLPRLISGQLQIAESEAPV